MMELTNCMFVLTSVKIVSIRESSIHNGVPFEEEEVLMIYITGDCHGYFERFNPSIFSEQKEMTKADYAIA